MNLKINRNSIQDKFYIFDEDTRSTYYDKHRYLKKNMQIEPWNGDYEGTYFDTKEAAQEHLNKYNSKEKKMNYIYEAEFSGKWIGELRSFEHNTVVFGKHRRLDSNSISNETTHVIYIDNLISMQRTDEKVEKQLIFGDLIPTQNFTFFHDSSKIVNVKLADEFYYIKSSSKVGSAVCSTKVNLVE